MNDAQDRYAQTPPKYRFRRRAAHRQSQLNLINTLLEKLYKLQNDTDPSLGQKSCNGKDAKAQYALGFAGKLVDITAGWAVDHAIGMALVGREFMQAQPSSNVDHPEHLKILAEADTHKHELEGGQQFEALVFRPEVARILLISLIRCNSAGFPLALQRMTLEGIRALLSGEATPLFEPTKTRKKSLYRELNLQLQAIVLVRYRHIKGMKLSDARQEVSDALCINHETIHTWENRVKKRLGDLEVSEAIATMRQTVSLTNEIGSDDHIDPTAYAEKLYGAEALARVAASFKDLRGGG